MHRPHRMNDLSQTVLDIDHILQASRVGSEIYIVSKISPELCLKYSKEETCAKSYADLVGVLFSPGEKEPANA